MKTLNILFFWMIMTSIFLSSCKDNQEILSLSPGSINNQKVNNAILDLNITTFSKQRSLQITNPSGSEQAKIQWNKGDKYKIHFALFCKENPQWITYGMLDGEVVKSSDQTTGDKGKLRIKGKISLSNGASISQGNWYIQVLLGPDDLFWKNSNDTLEMKYQLCDVDSTSRMNIPVASKWTKVNVKQDSIVSANIECNPIGCIFSCNVKSPLYDSMHIRKITIPKSVISTSGTFQFSLPTSDDEIPNGMPKWTSSKEDGKIILNNCNIKAYDGREKYRSSKKIYFWGMPGESTKLTARIFTSNDPGDQGISPKEISMGKALKDGFTYHINFELPKSDLMITELFHLNPGGNNYSMIEIYNPTTEAIDLTKYSLIRQRFIGKTPATHSVGIGYSMIVSGFHPSDFFNIIQEAVKQDLYIENEDVPVRRIDGIDVKKKRHPSFTDSETWSYLGEAASASHKWDQAKNRFGLLWNTDTPDRYNKMLKPGKCIIICSHKTLEALNKKEYENFPDKKVGGYIRHAVEEGDCQYIIAVDNGPHVLLSEYQHGDGGVMNHGLKHVMILMKDQKPIDVTGPFAYIDGHPKFQDLWTSPHSSNNGENRGTGWVYDPQKGSEIHYFPTNHSDATYTQALYTQFLAMTTGKTPENPDKNLYVLSTKADHYNLVRKPFVRYPSLEWNTRIDYKPLVKKDGSKDVFVDWSKDSEWVFINGEACGASYLSSWGTRVPRKDWIEKYGLPFLKTEMRGDKFDYAVYPKEYESGEGATLNNIKTESPANKIVQIPFE